MYADNNTVLTAAAKENSKINFFNSRTKCNSFNSSLRELSPTAKEHDYTTKMQIMQVNVVYKSYHV